MDSYVLSTFLFYFVMWLAAFVTMIEFYNFFELLKDVVKNHIAMSRVATFHLFLTPLLIYDMLPVGVLLAVLVTFGVMTKNNEVTAFKACGISDSPPRFARSRDERPAERGFVRGGLFLDPSRQPDTR